MRTPTIDRRDDQRAVRPNVDADRSRVRGLSGVGVVLRRELSTKFATKAFVLSTLLFAVMSVVFTLTMGGGQDTSDLRLGHTTATSQLAAQVASAGGVALIEVADSDEAHKALNDDDVDAVLILADGAQGYDVLVEGVLTPRLSALLDMAVHDQALRQVAIDNGAPGEQLANATAEGTITVVSVGETTEGGIGSLMVGLGFAAVAAMVILLCGIPLATDVMQEKPSRVVEILLTSVRPWQLLAGKVVATTIIGLTQLGVVLGSTYVALAISGSSFGLPDLNWGQALTGLWCVLLAIITCTTLMAGLAARVERQEDLSSVLQPAMAVTLVPVVAAVYLIFEFPESVWLDIASVGPIFNTFVLPARMSVETVPLWQIGISLLIAALTALACFAVAGRLYDGAVLRSGGRVSFRDALQNR